MPFTSEKGNLVTSGEGKGKFSYIRGRKREIQLHPGREKGDLVTSGKGEGKYSENKEKSKRSIRRKRHREKKTEN